MAELASRNGFQTQAWFFAIKVEWVGDGDGSIRVVPVDLDPIPAFRGSGSCGDTARLLGERQRGRQTEGE